jgi:hypothetical protein
MLVVGGAALVAITRPEHHEAPRRHVAAHITPVTTTTVAFTPPTEIVGPSTTRTTHAPATTVPVVANRVAFIGDSLAVNLGEAARALGAGVRPRIDVASDGTSGCGVARSGAYRLGGRVLALSQICAAWSDRWSDALRRDRPKVVVIQVGRHEVLDRQLDGVWTNILEPDYARYIEGELNLAISVAANDGREVVLLTAPHFHASDANRPEDDPARVERFNELLLSAARGWDRVYVVDLGGRASPGGEYADVVDGIKIRADGVHYSAAGAAWAANWLLPQVAPLLGGAAG